ncbi:MAG: hypothetical protein Q8R79_03210 [Legionellaceae bacterium]|nr:hypothetical protein [Legionellaceae bacterium]
MKKMGKRKSLSLARRIICDFMYFSYKMTLNTVAVEKHMKLSALIEAQRNCPVKLSWFAIFIKAFALISAKHAVLRQTYFSFPTPHIYEYEDTTAILTVERIFEEETIVLLNKIKQPEHLSLVALDAKIQKAKNAPLDQVRSFRTPLKINRLPFLLRRLCWWLAFNISKYRGRYLGTFLVTNMAHTVPVLSLRSPMSFNLTFDVFNINALSLVRFFYDHRLLDGVMATRIMFELEQVLLGEILDEIKAIG